MHVPDRLVADNNRFFFATVVSADAGTYGLEVAPVAANLPGLLNGTMLSSTMAAFLGMRQCALPQPGSRVFCYQVDGLSCLVLGVVDPPAARPNPDVYHARSVLGAGEGKSVGNNRLGYAVDTGTPKTTYANAGRPNDVVDGEHVVANDFGVLLGLFQQMAVLKASELAQVQAFLLDDLVRIVSHNFEHHTALGSTRVFQDGRACTQETTLTHDAAEAAGRPSVEPSDADLPPAVTLHGRVTPDDQDDFFALDHEDRQMVARLKSFVGALGDFLHVVLVRPAPGQVRIQDGRVPEVFDTGLADLRVGLDGSVGVRTAAAISLEKTTWIRVPHRTLPPEAPRPENAPAVEGPAPYRTDQTVSRDGLPVFQFLQLRDQLAQLQEGQGSLAFRNDGRFAVNDDPAKEPALGPGTPLAPGRTADYFPASAGIHLLPGGGIVLRDAWGSALVMEGGHIHLQPARDLVLQPLRNLVGKVGRQVSLSAREDLDLSSTDGGLRVKTGKAQYFYSSRSGIVLHSDAPAGEYFPREDQPVEQVGGIVLHAPEGGIASHSMHALHRTTENSVTKARLLMLDADDRLFARSSRGIDLFSGGDLLLSAATNLVGYTEGTAVFLGAANTALGFEEQTLAVGAFGPVQGLFRRDSFDRWRLQAEEIAGSDFQDYAFAYRDDDAFDGLLFRFPSRESYRIDPVADAVPMTLAQQENQVLGRHDLRPWMEEPVNGTYPYPGAGEGGTYATSTMLNYALDAAGRLRPKTSDLSAVGQVDFRDLFSEYLVHA
jgi:hypothetical protein